MSKFLPENYSVPESSSSGSYMKLEQGDNRFRVLSSAIVGYEAWRTEDGKNKPVRGKTQEEVIQKGFDNTNKFGQPQYPKHFWAFVVYNAKEERIEILQITQKAIMRAIENLVIDTDWGDPKNYDIVINRKGESTDTVYTVQPKPAKELEKKIKEEYEAMSIDLDQLYDGGDPFNPDKKNESIEDIPF